MKSGGGSTIKHGPARGGGCSAKPHVVPKIATSVGLVVERSLVRLPAGALSSQLWVNSAFHPSGVGKSSTGLFGWG